MKSKPSKSRKPKEIIEEKPKKSRKAPKREKRETINDEKLEKLLTAFYDLIGNTGDRFSNQISEATRYFKYLTAAIEHLEKQYKGLYEIILQNQIGVQNVYDKINVILNVPEYQKRINKSLKMMVDYAYLTDPDEKDWLIDQIARELLGNDYGMWAEKRECKNWKTGRRPPLQMVIANREHETENQKTMRKLIEDAERE